jgi:hypothetical protein
MIALTVRSLKGVTIAVWGEIEHHENGFPFAQLSFLQTRSANQAEMAWHADSSASSTKY